MGGASYTCRLRVASPSGKPLWPPSMGQRQPAAARGHLARLIASPPHRVRIASLISRDPPRPPPPHRAASRRRPESERPQVLAQP